jgi:hypothetical protein
MDLDLVRRLNSPDPAERRAAIITMGKGGNPEDLPLLKQIYQTDPDPALRKLALDAGRYIKRQQAGGGSRPRAASRGGGKSSSGTLLKRKTSSSRRKPPRQAAASPPVPDYTDTDDPQPPVFSDYGETPLFEDSDIYEPYEVVESAPPPTYVDYSDDYSAGYGDAGDSGGGAYDNGSTGYGYEIISGPGSGLRTVTAEDRKQAEQYVREARKANRKRERGSAFDFLIKALDANPDIAAERGFKELAGEVMKQSPDDAVEIIADSSRRAMYRPKDLSGAKKKASKVDSDITWVDVALDLGIQFFLNLIGVTLVIMFGMSFLMTMVPGNMSSTMQADVAALNAITLPIALVAGAGAGVSQAFGTVISLWAVHFVIARFMGGIGTLLETLHGLIPVQIAITIGTFVMMGAAIALEAEGIGLLIFLLQIGSIYWQSSTLARIHNVGAWSGCMAIFIAPIFLAIFYCLGSLVIQMLFQGASFAITGG